VDPSLIVKPSHEPPDSRREIWILALICACIALAGCGASRSDRLSGVSLANLHDGKAGTGHVRAASASSPFTFFSPQSFWNRPVPASAPLDPSSAALVSALNEEVNTELSAGNGPWINTAKYSIPIYTVPANEPTVSVKLVHSSAVPVLQSAWRAVPLPANAHPARGTDADLVVWQPSTDRLWEFWRLAHGANGWRASWGGATTR